MKVGIDPLEERQGGIDEVRNEKTVNPNRAFKQSINQKGFTAAVYEPSAKETPEGQTTHKGGEYGGHGVVRVAEDKSEQAGPHHFINKTGGTGDEEKKKNPNAEIGSAQMSLFQ